MTNIGEWVLYHIIFVWPVLGIWLLNKVMPLLFDFRFSHDGIDTRIFGNSITIFRVPRSEIQEAYVEALWLAILSNPFATISAANRLKCRVVIVKTEHGRFLLTPAHPEAALTALDLTDRH